MLWERILWKRKSIFIPSWVRPKLTKPWLQFPLFKIVLIFFLGCTTLNFSCLWRLFLSPLRSEDFRLFIPSGLDLLTNLIVTFLSPIYSPTKIPSNSASLETAASLLQSTGKPTTITPDTTPSLSTVLQFAFSLLENDQSETTEELPAFSSLLYDVWPLPSRPNHLKVQLDHSNPVRQHRRE